MRPALPVNALSGHNAVMRILLIGALALVLAAPASAADEAPGPRPQPPSQPRPQPQAAPSHARETLLQELRNLDASQDEDGDHVVGEHLC